MEKPDLRNGHHVPEVQLCRSGSANDEADNQPVSPVLTGRREELLQTHVHGIAWVLCQRLPDEFDNDSLFSIGWCDILRNNYFDGHNLKWVATMLNPDSNIARPASL